MKEKLPLDLYRAEPRLQEHDFRREPVGKTWSALFSDRTCWPPMLDLATELQDVDSTPREDATIQ